MTQLSAFIRDNTEQILAEWESFARGLPTAESMDVVALRDHAKEMLLVVARDLDAPQTVSEEISKATGNAPSSERRQPTAAQAHGAGRAESGFTVSQMVSEFRALRASVVRLWSRQLTDVTIQQLQDLTRFHEAIDQTITESLVRFSEEIKQSKERFLAILGHDLRTPLSAVITSSAFLLENGELSELQLPLIAGIATSSRRMNQMVMDLLDFAQTRFGDRIPIERQAVDIGRVLGDVVAEISVASPERVIDVQTSGDLCGQWDGDRLAQVLTNLVGNAIDHGAADAPIVVGARGGEREVVISVQSAGTPIPENQLRQVFDAMSPTKPEGARDRRHLGLGLYIVNKIVAAHGGSVGVESSASSGTTFTVHLPRAIG
jgi:signal transduction histidine kinase